MELGNETDLSEIRAMLFEYMRAKYPYTQTSFDLWFGNLKLTYLDGSKAVFCCENFTKQKVLNERYLGFIKESLEEIMGYVPEVSIAVDTGAAASNDRDRDKSNVNDREKDNGRGGFVGADMPAKRSLRDDGTAKNYASRENMAFGGDDGGSDGFDDGSGEGYFADYDDFSDSEPEGESETFTPMPPADSNNRSWSRPQTPDRASYGDEKSAEPAELADSAELAERLGKKADGAGESSREDKWRDYIKDYTFENFIVGSSNQLAHASAMNVADNVGSKVNPLFIWGPSGLGKTHLMYAIANRALSHNPDMKIICIKGEEFTNQLVEAIQKNRNRQFRQKYRSCDMLMIDDIQFIAGKEATQTEFFHTFDALYEDKKQIILTSDRPPRELESLEQRIRSRFEQGLLADIKPPDYELRMAILRNKINQNHVDVPTEVVDFLAQNLQENIRQLEGVIKKLAMSNLLTGQPVNMEMVIQTVPEYLRDAEPVSDVINRIIECVARRYEVPVGEIMGTSRKKEIKTARNVAMYVVRSVTGASLPQIGQVFKRDHSTVHSNINMIEGEIASDPVLDAQIHEILKEVKRG